MTVVRTEFTVPQTSDRVVLAIQDVLDQYGWPIMDISPTRVVADVRYGDNHNFIFPKLVIQLEEGQGVTDVDASISLTSVLFGNKKRMTGELGRLVNSISIRAQTESIAINPTVSIGEGQNEGRSSHADSRVSQLRELKDLLDSGVLTESEFQAEKARILNS